MDKNYIPHLLLTHPALVYYYQNSRSPLDRKLPSIISVSSSSNWRKSAGYWAMLAQVQLGALFLENISENGLRRNITISAWSILCQVHFSLLPVGSILTKGCGCFAKSTQGMRSRPRQNVIHVFLCLFSFHFFLYFLKLLFSARRFELKNVFVSIIYSCSNNNAMFLP